MQSGLYVEGLSKAVKGRVVLEALSLRLAPSDFYMLLGENGAGKTTFFRCLLGLASHSGAVRVVGTGGAASSSCADFAPVLDRSTLFGSWTVKANVNYQLNSSRAHRLPIVETLVPADLMRRTAGKLSTGQRKIVMMAIALASDAPVLLLDEFANGLDWTHRQQMRHHLQRAIQSGRIIIATGHELEAFEGLPTRVGKLAGGKLFDLTEAYAETGRLKEIYETPPQ